MCHARYLALVLATLHIAASSAKLTLDVKAAPRVVVLPGRVTVTAILRGGNNSEDLYCPTVQWDWGADEGQVMDLETHARALPRNEGQSETTSDCPPFVEGETAIQRTFQATHLYGATGSRLVQVTLRKGNKALATGSVYVKVTDHLGLKAK